MSVRIITGDALTELRKLPDGCVDCCVTSPPYWGLRSYLPEGDPLKALEIGCEATPGESIAALVEVFREVRRVLADDGTLWINVGDAFAGSWGAQSRMGGNERNQMAKRQVQVAQRHGSGTGSMTRTPGLKPKDMVLLPARLAIALQDDGWWVRQTVIWQKTNCMPESVEDRPTTAHEYVIFLTKSRLYFYDHEAVREAYVYGPDHHRNVTTPPVSHVPGAPPHTGLHRGGNRKRSADAAGQRHSRYETGNLNIENAERGNGRNLRSVWTMATDPYPGHPAAMPRELVRNCIRAGCKPGGTVLDPFAGSGTVGLVADQEQRSAILIDLNPKDAELARERIMKDSSLFTQVVAAPKEPVRQASMF